MGHLLFVGSHKNWGSNMDTLTTVISKKLQDG